MSGERDERAPPRARRLTGVKAGWPEILNLGSASHWKAACGESRTSSLEGGS
jgi:hypothetical protein